MARDDKKNPLISTFDWTADAAQRILRVPAGFMRNRTQDRIEALAAEHGRDSINLALVEEGIAIGRQLMEEMIKNQAAARGVSAEEPAASPHAASPHSEGNGTSASGDASHAVALEATPPADRKPPINEVGSPSALQARRAGPHPELEGG